jgi:protein O-mannosyl-transferase
MWMMAAALVALSLLVYATAFTNGFALDDTGIILENPTIRSLANIGRIFRTSYWATGQAGMPLTDPGLYRPLTVLTYIIDYRLWGLHAAPYHVENVLLHTVVTVLVFRVAITVLESRIAAFASAAIFAVHPIHTDAVASIVGRAELLAALFVLLAFLLARRARDSQTVAHAIGAAALYFVALLCKESAATLPAILLLDDWLHRDEIRSRTGWLRAAAIRYGALVVAVGVYLALRTGAVAGHGVWFGWGGVSAGARVLTAVRVLLEYIGLFLFPRHLLPDYWRSDVPIAHSIAEPMVLLALTIWIALGALIATKLRRDRRFVLSTLWYFITILPASNIFFASGVGKAERILYLPSVGLCMLVGWAALRLSERAPLKRLAPVFAIVLVALGARTFVRNRDWASSGTLAFASLSISPNSPLMNEFAARELILRGDLPGAIDRFQQALHEAPHVALTHTHLASAFMAHGDLDSAIAEYHRAIELEPNNAEMHSNLGLAYMNGGRMQDAVRELQLGARLAQGSPQPHVNLGVLYMRLGNFGAAVTELQQAVQLAPQMYEAHLNLGIAFLRQQNAAGAESEFRVATQLNPDSPEAHNNFGFVLLQRGSKPQAIEEFRAALRLRPNYANAQANLQKALQP